MPGIYFATFGYQLASTNLTVTSCSRGQRDDLTVIVDCGIQDLDNLLRRPYFVKHGVIFDIPAAMMLKQFVHGEGLFLVNVV